MERRTALDDGLELLQCPPTRRGSSSYGQLGFGEMGNPGAPVAVTGGHSFISITAGREETFGVLPNGTGMAWVGWASEGSTPSSVEV